MADQVWPDQVFQILGFREGRTPTPKPLPHQGRAQHQPLARVRDFHLITTIDQ
jgi:hypothetical protein